MCEEQGHLVGVISGDQGRKWGRSYCARLQVRRTPEPRASEQRFVIIACVCLCIIISLWFSASFFSVVGLCYPEACQRLVMI